MSLVTLVPKDVKDCETPVDILVIVTSTILAGVTPVMEVSTEILKTGESVLTKKALPDCTP